MRPRVVVLGFGASGSTYALLVKKLAREAEVIAIEESRWPPYSRCGLPYLLSGTVGDHLDLLYAPKRFYEESGVRVLYEHRVEELDPSGRRVVATGRGGRVTLEYDVLAYALGSRPVVPRVPGIDEEGVLTFYAMDDALALRRYARKARSAVVVGAGPTGFEVAVELARRGLKVDSVFMEPWPLYQLLDRDMASRVASDAERLGVRFHPSVKLEEISRSGSGLRVALSGGKELRADVVVLATGVRPNTELAREAGLRVGPAGGLVVDEYLRAVGFSDVYGVGTVVECRNLATGKPATFMLGSFAVQVARVAASNTAGRRVRFRGAVQAAVVKGFTVLAGSAGLTLRQAKEEGFEAVHRTVIYPEKAHYMPDSTRTVVKLVADARTGRVLGGQVVGYTSAVKGRVDLIAAAVRMGATVEDLSLSDWSYTPAASDVWEPVTTAAYLLSEKLKGGG